MEKIDIDIQCQKCNGTGVYVGVAERDGAAVVCSQCKGTGKYNYVFEYEEFKGKNVRDGVKRVYRSSYGFCIAPTEIPIAGSGMINMALEGVSYEDFKNGKLPGHTKKLACPMLADQGACHGIKGFTDECERLHGDCLWGVSLSQCSNQHNKLDCWERFELATGKE